MNIWGKSIIGSKDAIKALKKSLKGKDKNNYVENLVIYTGKDKSHFNGWSTKQLEDEFKKVKNERQELMSKLLKQNKQSPVDFNEWSNDQIKQRLEGYVVEDVDKDRESMITQLAKHFGISPEILKDLPTSEVEAQLADLEKRENF